jgi:hypothetical protein
MQRKYALGAQRDSYDPRTASWTLLRNDSNCGCGFWDSSRTTLEFPAPNTDELGPVRGIVRFGERVSDDGSIEILALGPNGAWMPFLDIPAADALTTRLDRLSAEGRSVFLLDTRGRDKAALVEIDVASRSATLLAEDPEADVTRVLYHPDTGRSLAAVAVALRQRWHLVDPDFGADLARHCADAGDAEIQIDDVGDGLERLMFFVERSDAAGEHHLYERKTGTVLHLFKEQDGLESMSLRPMQATIITVRDDLRMPSYLTRPDATVVLDWWHAAVRFEHALQAARGLDAGTAENHLADQAVRGLERAKWRLWHGRWSGCRRKLASLCRWTQRQPLREVAGIRRLQRHVSDVLGYLERNHGTLVHYAARRRHGEPISTAFVESAVEIVARRMNKKQQMRWNRMTVPPFLDVRTAVLNGTLESVFRQHYPGFRPANADHGAIAAAA